MLTCAYIIYMEELEYLQQFANKVKELRLQKQMSQERLAFESGLHRTFIGMVERLERNPSLTSIHKIAKGLGVNITDLF